MDEFHALCVVMQVAVFGVPSYLEYWALAQTTVVCGTWSTTHNWAEMVWEFFQTAIPYALWAQEK